MTRSLSLLASLLAFAPASALGQDSLYTLNGFDVDGQFGADLAPLPDLDGDGLSDFAVTASAREIGAGPNAGNLGVIEARSTRTGNLIWRLQNDSEQLSFASNLADIEDIDGDGFRDLVAGNPAHSGGSLFLRGRVLLISGATGQVIRQWLGGAADEWLGAAVIAIPDRDGDGIEDIAASRPRLFLGPAQFGTVSIFSSVTGALIQTTDYPLGGPTVGRQLGRLQDLDGDGVDEWFVHVDLESTPVLQEGYSEVISGATGQILFELRGQHTRESFGWKVLPIPDYNGDGQGDLVVLSPYFQTPDPSNIRVYVISGADRSTLHVFEIPGEAGGGLVVSPALIDDMDLDGYPELAVGLPMQAEPHFQSGRVQIHSLRTGLELHRVTGASEPRLFGWSLLSTGDVDFDGRNDLLVGAPALRAFGIQDDLHGQVTLISGPLDVRYSFCPASASSIGVPASLTGTGTNSLAINDLALQVTDLPRNRFGIFVVSETLSSPVVYPGTAGPLCLGGHIGRMNRSHEILSSGSAGTFQLNIDLTDLPLVGGIGAASAAQTIYFQAWYRDLDPLPTSNFSSGLAVVVRP